MKLGYMAGSLAAVLIGLPSVANANCAELQAQYRKDADLASRYMSMSSALNGEASTAQNAAESRQANALSRMRLIVDQLKAAGCRVPPAPVSEAKYQAEALRCRIALIMSRYQDGSEVDQKCDVSKWTGESVPN